MKKSPDDDGSDSNDGDTAQDAGDQFGGKNSKKKLKFKWLLGLCEYCVELFWINISLIFYNILQIFFYSNTMNRTCRLATISQIKSSQRRIVSSAKVRKSHDTQATKYGRPELDSHADTCVAGANCIYI